MRPRPLRACTGAPMERRDYVDIESDGLRARCGQAATNQISGQLVSDCEAQHALPGRDVHSARARAMRRFCFNAEALAEHVGALCAGRTALAESFDRADSANADCAGTKATNRLADSPGQQSCDRPLRG